jgi:hypothetical protein
MAGREHRPRRILPGQVLMAKARFVRHPSFPASKTQVTGGGTLWKMQVSEWAFAEVNLTDVDPGLTVTSNNPTVVPDHRPSTPEKIRGTAKPGSRDMTVRFYAKSRGFTFIHLFGSDPTTAVSDLLQVEVTQRRAPSEAGVTQTTLSGATCAINAWDAQAYRMDNTFTFDRTETDPAKIFAQVPAGLDHLAIGAHGGFQNDAEMSDPKKMSLYVCGNDTRYYRIKLSDVKTAFGTLKGKIRESGVIWIGGCNIAANREFCFGAAQAAGATVVAPGYPLLNKKYPKGKMDILDGLCLPTIFSPDAAKTLVSAADFCARQEACKFSVPV